MFDKLQAIGIHVLVKPDPPPSEKGGLIIPDSAKKKTSQGEILSVGGHVKDKAVKKGRKAIFAQGSGFPIEVEGDDIWVLQEGQIIVTT